jgi:hypothetical protein
LRRWRCVIRGVPVEPTLDEYAFLRDAPVARPGSERDGARELGGRRRRNVVVLVLGLAVAAAGVGAAAMHLPHGDEPAADVTILPTAPPTAPPTTTEPISQNPVPPPRGAPFPVGAGGLRHSGGPYVARSRIAASVLARLECSLGRSRRGMPGFTCARVDVAFFARYADAWKLRGASWVFVHAWGADREMYVVTVWGHLPSAPPAALTEITTMEIDATTGRTMMEGGPPLPAADANR